jgi:serine/threonine-protein kinase RsbW
VKKTQSNINKKPKLLTIKSRTSYLSDVRKFVSGEAKKFGFSDEEVNKITLAVDEACTNIIKHAYKYAGDYPIHLELIARNNTFQVAIEDKGAAFDPDSIKLPDMKEHLRSYKRGGFGMYLMKSLVDKVEYKIQPGVKNRVVLTKYLRITS